MMVNHYCLGDRRIVALHSKQTTFLMIKKITTSIFMLSLGIACQAQSPITIQASDIPVPSSPFNMVSLPITGLPATSLGTNQSWNYSAYIGSSPSQNEYLAETDSYFTNAGIDIYLDGTKSFNSNFSYYISNEWDFNANAIDDKGYYVYPQNYSLLNFTGNAADSLFMPEQKYILPTPRKIFSFPFSYQSHWASDSRRSTQFFLNVASYGLTQAPAEHAYHAMRSDSIVAWGKLKLYTASGPSAEVDVLVDKVATYAIDSFYLNGSPAPQALLTAFGVTQGQQTNTLYYYNFIRKNAVNYLMRLVYDSDPTYTTMTAAFVNTDNLAPTSVSSNEPTLYMSSVYPNPATANSIHVMIGGQAPEALTYTMLNMAGQCVQQGEVSNLASGLELPIHAHLPNGIYTLTLNNKQQQAVVQHTFTLQR